MDKTKMTAGAEAPADEIRETYLAAVKDAAIHRYSLTGCCPFCGSIYDGQNFAVDLRTGDWYCFAEGISGNYSEFKEKLKLNSQGVTQMDETKETAGTEAPAAERNNEWKSPRMMQYQRELEIARKVALLLMENQAVVSELPDIFSITQKILTVSIR